MQAIPGPEGKDNFGTYSCQGILIYSVEIRLRSKSGWLARPKPASSAAANSGLSAGLREP